MVGPKGGLIRTFSGLDLDPRCLASTDFRIEDIAHSHANMNRWCGHARRPISVAQHCVYVCRIVADLTEGDPTACRQALLHDAAEAYVGDVTRWLKRTEIFTEYRKLEDAIQWMIYNAFQLPIEEHPAIKRADSIMVRFEGKQAFGPDFRIDHEDYPDLTPEEVALVGRWSPWSWREAEELFLVHWRMYQ
jgi:hypothetical protein